MAGSPTDRSADGAWLVTLVVCPFAKALISEITGEIIERGADVEYLKVGDLVSVPFNVACGRCRMCREGRTDVCLNVNERQAGGAYGYVDLSGCARQRAPERHDASASPATITQPQLRSIPQEHPQ